MDPFVSELIAKIKIAAAANVSDVKRHFSTPITAGAFKGLRNCIIAIGASTGGTAAIDSLLRAFPQDMPGTVIVQHMPAVFTRMYAERLNNLCAVEVKEAKTGDVVLPGRVLIAPGDYHMRIKRFDTGYKIDCFQGEKVNGHCPAVDVLFNSVAEQTGNNAIGIILTGMGNDGAGGLLKMRRMGAKTIGQDEQSAVVYGMPKVAFEIGAVQEQAALDLIPKRLLDLVRSSR
jgi:two-component system chemotaxis response regulator CheB